LKVNRTLIKVNRLCAWTLLILMTAYLITGYAWTKGIIMPVSMARQLHLSLDPYFMPVFLSHVLLSARFALKRWGIRRSRKVDLALLFIGLAIYALALMVDLY
jgi:hypothetical protein